MKKIFFVVILSLLFGSNLWAQAEYEDYVVKCPAAKEYITTLNYLRDRESLGFNEAEMQEASLKVSKGCLGAAERFTKTFETMMKTQAGARGSLALAMELADKTDSYTETFLEIFKKSYLAEYLDLDYGTALQMARSLSIEYTGDPIIAEKDFLRLVDFCTNDKWLGLSKPRCGVIAGRVIKTAENFKREVAPLFEKVFEFIISDRGPTPDLMMALDLSEKLVAMGPDSPENFMQAYRFAVNEDGLRLTAKDSIDFAMKISHHAQFKDPDVESGRLPASENE